MAPRAALLLSLVAPLAAAGRPAAGRALHWTIRVSDLQATLNFTHDILGMRILRHEEHDAPCATGCNGQYDNTHWSRTMVGYEREDTAFALELTYNYGVDSYEVGGGLRRFVLEVADDAAALEALVRLARSRGHRYQRLDPVLPTLPASEIYQTAEAAIAAADRAFEADGGGTEHVNKMAMPGPGAVVLTGPDNYAYELRVKSEPHRLEPFRHVITTAEDSIGLASFYKTYLRMREYPMPNGHPPGSRLVGYADTAGGREATRLLIEQYKWDDPTVVPGDMHQTMTQWEGRLSFSLPEATLRSINAKLQEEDAEEAEGKPKLILHAMAEVEDAHLGTLLVLVLKDPAGYEVALVAAEAFGPAVASATDYVGPDWAERAAIVAAMAANASTSGHEEL